LGVCEIIRSRESAGHQALLKARQGKGYETNDLTGCNTMAEKDLLKQIEELLTDKGNEALTAVRQEIALK
jgi:hypothetical protein